MKKTNLIIENSLLKLSYPSPELKKYLKGWERSLSNFNDFIKDELESKRSSPKVCR